MKVYEIYASLLKDSWLAAFTNYSVQFICTGKNSFAILLREDGIIIMRDHYKKYQFYLNYQKNELLPESILLHDNEQDHFILILSENKLILQLPRVTSIIFYRFETTKKDCVQSFS